MSNSLGKEREILKSCQSLVAHFMFSAILKDYLVVLVQRFTVVWRVMARTHCDVLIHKDWFMGGWLVRVVLKAVFPNELILY